MTFLLTISYSKMANFILSQLFHLAVIVIQKFSKMSKQKDKVSQLGCCGESSIGLEVFHLLKKHHLALIPSYESHDLKHILLGIK